VEGDISALSGTGFGAHLSVLGLHDLFNSDCRVLCIGVGTGEWVRDCARAAQEVWALDVSPQAKRTLPEEVHFTCDSASLPANSFDLAMSHYVAPHMSDHDLEVQLNHVVPALKPDGTLGMMYKEPLTPDQTVDNWAGEPREVGLARCAGILRRRSHMAEIVAWAGGEVVQYVLEMPSEFYKMIEVTVHIKRCM